MFSAGTGTESDKAIAATIIEQSNQIHDAVDLVVGNGCDDTQISFQNPRSQTYDNSENQANYVNPNAPSDKSCHVFDVAGGKTLWMLPPKGANTVTAYQATWPKGIMPYIVGGYASIPGMGTNAPELVLYLPISAVSLCEELNRKLGISTIPTSTLYWCNGCVGHFVGTYYAYNYNNFLRGVESACALSGSTFSADTGAPYFFYRVLRVR